MMFQYGIGNAFDSLAWQTPGSQFTWSSPVTGGTAASVNGNTVGRVNDVGGTITGLNWKDGETLWLRWIENDDSGTDHGLAIDNFSITARQATTAKPVPDALPLSYAFTTLLGICAWARRLT
ncbi:MAG: hypothetical protein H7Y43_14775 [Akkermansiaceae bacterium]|nr:hypothetical protein [Verrucomicrobiales bacterium]